MYVHVTGFPKGTENNLMADNFLFCSSVSQHHLKMCLECGKYSEYTVVGKWTILAYTLNFSCATLYFLYYEIMCCFNIYSYCLQWCFSTVHRAVEQMKQTERKQSLCPLSLASFSVLSTCKTCNLYVLCATVQFLLAYD